MGGMDTSTLPESTTGPSEPCRTAEDRRYRSDLMETCDKFSHSLSVAASPDLLAKHLGDEWFTVYELVGMATTALYLVSRTAAKDFPF